MKLRATLSILVLVLTTAGFAQSGGPCTTPVPAMIFQQVMRSVQGQQQPSARLSEAVRAAHNNCFSSAQVKQIASLFDNDVDRLEFCKAAYINTTDKENFYDVYDVFAYFSTVFRLHDSINRPGEREREHEHRKPTPPPAPVDPYKNITFPDYRTYNGTKGCSLPLADADFDVAMRHARNLNNDMERSNVFQNLCSGNCLTTAQLMKMALTMETETARLSFLKGAYARCYDQGNYVKMIQVFKHQPNQDDLIAFYNQQNPPKSNEPPPPPPCQVTDADMASIKSTLARQNVESTKVGTIKQILRSKKCFTVAQVKAIIRTVAVESYKIDLAKYAYEFTLDKDNYYEVADVFAVESYKRELTEFLNSRQR